LQAALAHIQVFKFSLLLGVLRLHWQACGTEGIAVLQDA
jgi:hypothetical protein